MKKAANGKWVVCAGDVAVDMIVPYGEMKRHLRALAEGKVPDGPKPIPYRRPGGTSGNTAAFLGQLTVPTVIASRISAESGGRFLMNDLKRYGLNTDYLIQEGPDAAMLVAILDENDRIMFKWTDPEARIEGLLRGDLPDSLVGITGIAVLSGVNVMAGTQRGIELTEFAERCKQKGATVAVDLNLRVESFGFDAGRRALIERIIAASDIVFGSGVEEFGMWGGAGDFESSVVAFAQRYPSKIVAARNGPGPAMLVQGGEASFFPPLDVEVVNMVGAGDAFNAGFIAATHRGLDPKTAMKYGIAVACHAISHTEIRAAPDEAELQRLVAMQR